MAGENRQWPTVEQLESMRSAGGINPERVNHAELARMWLYVVEQVILAVDAIEPVDYYDQDEQLVGDDSGGLRKALDVIRAMKGRP